MNRLCQIYTTRRLATTYGAPAWGSPATDRYGAPSSDRQSTTQGCCPEFESDFSLVARTADFDGRGGIHTAEGGHPAPEPQGVPREVWAVPETFPDGLSEDSLRDGGQCQKNIGSLVDMSVDTVSPMQKDMAILREENRVLRTPATSQAIQTPRRAALTTTKVQRFDGTTSWEQYHQVFVRLCDRTAVTMIQQHCNCSRI